MVPVEYISPTTVNRFTFLSSKGLKFVRASNAIVHSALSTEIDYDHKKALSIVLQDCTDEQIVAEFAQRIADRKHEEGVKQVNQKYHFERLLGKGTSATVHLVYNKETGVGYACKIFQKATKNDPISINADIEAMKTAKHECIISLFEYFESPNCVWFIMELTDSIPLRSMLKQSEAYGKPLESFICRLITQILKGVEYLHSKGIVHRDLKLDHIFYQGDISTGQIKISNFGLSTMNKSETCGSNMKDYTGLKERWGTVTHASPELIFNDGYGSQTDLWSVGCLLYEMITESQAFPLSKIDLIHNNVDLYHKIKGCKYDRSKLKGRSQGLQDLVSKLLQVNPVKRYNSTEALNDPFLITPILKKHPIQTAKSSSNTSRNPSESSQVMTKLSRGTRIPLGTIFPPKQSLRTERIYDENSINHSNDIENILLFENSMNTSGIVDSMKLQSQYNPNNHDMYSDMKKINYSKRQHGCFNAIFRFRKEKY